MPAPRQQRGTGVCAGGNPLRSLVVGAALLCSLCMALAHSTGELLFHEDFTQEDPAWEPAEGLTVGSGRAELKPRKGTHDWTLYGGLAFTDADISVDIIVPPHREETIGGLIFWAQSNNSWFALRISTAHGGYAQVLRLQGDSFLNRVSWRKVPALRTSAGSTNQLRVTLKGKSASALINGAPFVNFKGASPTGGRIGLYASSGDHAANAWQFTNLSVRRPSP